MDPYTITKVTHPDSSERWNAALDRALAAGLMIRPGLFGGMWTVTSKSRPDLCYAVDATHCGCAAAEKGDPICMHRALYRYVAGGMAATPKAPSTVVQFVHRRGEPRPAA